MIDINLNDEVLVRLTQYAHEIMRENHNKLFNGAKYAPEFHPPVADKDGWTKMQMWILMSELGDSMYNGNPRQAVLGNVIRLQTEC